MHNKYFLLIMGNLMCDTIDPNQKKFALLYLFFQTN